MSRELRDDEIRQQQPIDGPDAQAGAPPADFRAGTQPYPAHW
jgi:hypothetical protein